MTADVFVSYSREDLANVRPIISMLEAQGWSVFWDRKILPGQQWSTLIEEKLRAAKAVLVVWSRFSVQSEWVKAEAMAARERGILVPVRIDATPIPLPFGLIQTADLNPEQPADKHEAQETLQLLMTNLSRLIALPFRNTSAAAHFAPEPARHFATAPGGHFVGATGGRYAATALAGSISGANWTHVLFELDGRINRRFYWIPFLLLACMGFLIDFIAEAMVRATRPSLLPAEAAAQAGLVSFFVLLYPSIAIAVKRLHDFDWSGWWAAPLLLGSFFATTSSPYIEHGTPEEALGAWVVVLLLGLLPAIIVGVVRGTPGANQHGPPPD